MIIDFVRYISRFRPKQRLVTFWFFTFALAINKVYRGPIRSWNEMQNNAISSDRTFYQKTCASVRYKMHAFSLVLSIQILFR